MGEGSEQDQTKIEIRTVLVNSLLGLLLVFFLLFFEGKKLSL